MIISPYIAVRLYTVVDHTLMEDWTVAPFFKVNDIGFFHREVSKLAIKVYKDFYSTEHIDPKIYADIRKNIIVEPCNIDDAPDFIQEELKNYPSYSID